MVVVAKTARCGTPVFAPIEIERLMMRVGQRRDVMRLWRDLRSLELVGCSGSPWMGSGGQREPREGKERRERINTGATTERNDEI